MSAPAPIPTPTLPVHRSRGLRARLASLRKEDGVAVVEFALIVPALLALYVGGAEFCNAMMNSQAVTRLARTTGDLTSLGDTSNPMRQSAMDDIFAASALVLRPFDSTAATIRVSAIGIYMNGTRRTVRICSATGKNIGARTVGVAPSDLVIPASYATHGMRLIVSEVSMTYKPIMGAAFKRLTKIATDGSYALPATLIWPTRGGTIATTGANAEVILPGGAACPATST